MTSSTTPDPSGAACPSPDLVGQQPLDSGSAPRVARHPAPDVGAQSLFPPKEADAETRRRWLATSPWPEVVFAAAV